MTSHSDGVAHCGACLIAGVVDGPLDVAWVESRFPQLDDPSPRSAGRCGRVATFRAKNCESGKTVILSLCRNDDMNRGLLDLAKRTGLRQDTFAKVLDYGELDGYSYQIEERPPGERLDRAIGTAGVTRIEMLDLLPGISVAIREAAAQGVHLDGSTDSIYLSDNGKLTLVGGLGGGRDDSAPPLIDLQHHPAVGTAIGPYQLIELLGEGGFAEVYRAQQSEPVAREVALKILKPGMDTRQALARFSVERQALAQMSHSGIARIYDAGVTGAGRPYIAMELVEGSPFSTYADDRTLPLTERVRLLVTVCRAIDHGHAKSVVHRDLKPSNIIVSEENGKATPRVIDFGIAHMLDEPVESRTFLTLTRQFIGSPAYMSPEQVGGGAINARSDIFALGCLLYEILTGEPPIPESKFAEASMKDFVNHMENPKVRHPADSFADLSQRDRERLAGLRSTDSRSYQKTLTKRGPSEIALKAISAKPEQRYQSAAAMADDLQAWADDRSITAPRRRRRAIHRLKKCLLVLAIFTALLAVAWHFSPLGRRPATSRDDDGTLRPVVLFQLDGTLQSSLPGGPDLVPIGEPDLTFEEMEIAGATAGVLHFPRFDPSQWLKIENRLGVNGPWFATETNEWTLVFDLMFPEITGPITLFQCHSENSGPGEVELGPGGLGNRFGLNYGFVREGEWNRIAITSRVSGRAQIYTVYLNGTRLGIPWVRGRHSAGYAFDDEFLILCEGNGKTGEGYLNSFAIYDLPLTDEEVWALGAPGAEGIPAGFKPDPKPEMPDTLLAKNRFFPPAGQPGQRFGHALAMNLSEAWVGAPYAGQSGKSSGIVRRYRLSRNGKWEGLGRIGLPADLNEAAEFGTDLAMNEKIALVAAPGTIPGGALYRYQKRGPDWSEPERLDGPEGTTRLGQHLGLAGETPIASAISASGESILIDFGAEAEVIATSPAGEITSLVCEGDLMAVGTANGRLLIYGKSGVGEWVEKYQISLQKTPVALSISPDHRFLALATEENELHLYQKIGEEWHRSAIKSKGSRVRFTGNRRLLIGDPEAFFAGKRTGKVTVFELIGGQWLPVRTIIPALGSIEGKFGSALASSANRIWVGAREDHTDRQVGGAAYALVLPTFEDQNVATKAPDFTWGSSVAIEGGIAAIGTPGVDERIYGGDLQILRLGQSGSWEPAFQKTIEGGGGHHIGFFQNLSISEERVGASVLDRVQVFEPEGSTWRLSRELLTSGERLFTFGPDEAVFVSRAGCRVLPWDRAETNMIPAENPLAGGLPTALSHAADRLVITLGNPEKEILVMQKQNDQWTEEIRILSPAPLLTGDSFGAALDHDASHLAIACPNSIASDRGTVFIYALQDLTNPPVRLSCPEEHRESSFGVSVAIENGIALVGCPRIDRGTAPGRVYEFRLDPATGSWSHTRTLQASNAEQGDGFGIHLALDQGRAIIGAKTNCAYFFKIGPDLK